MKDVFEIMLGKRAEQGKILFDKVTFTMPEFIIQDELIYQARAEALECSFILFCSDLKYLKPIEKKRYICKIFR